MLCYDVLKFGLTKLNPKLFFDKYFFNDILKNTVPECECSFAKYAEDIDISQQSILYLTISKVKVQKRINISSYYTYIESLLTSV